METIPTSSQIDVAIATEGETVVLTTPRADDLTVPSELDTMINFNGAEMTRRKFLLTAAGHESTKCFVRLSTGSAGILMPSKSIQMLYPICEGQVFHFGGKVAEDEVGCDLVNSSAIIYVEDGIVRFKVTKGVMDFDRASKKSDKLEKVKENKVKKLKHFKKHYCFNSGSDFISFFSIEDTYEWIQSVFDPSFSQLISRREIQIAAVKRCGTKSIFETLKNYIAHQNEEISLAHLRIGEALSIYSKITKVKEGQVCKDPEILALFDATTTPGTLQGHITFYNKYVKFSEVSEVFLLLPRTLAKEIPSDMDPKHMQEVYDHYSIRRNLKATKAWAAQFSAKGQKKAQKALTDAPNAKVSKSKKTKKSVSTSQDTDSDKEPRITELSEEDEDLHQLVAAAIDVEEPTAEERWIRFNEPRDILDSVRVEIPRNPRVPIRIKEEPKPIPADAEIISLEDEEEEVLAVSAPVAPIPALIPSEPEEYASMNTKEVEAKIESHRRELLQIAKEKRAPGFNPKHLQVNVVNLRITTNSDMEDAIEKERKEYERRIEMIKRQHLLGQLSVLESELKSVKGTALDLQGTMEPPTEVATPMEEVPLVTSHKGPVKKNAKRPRRTYQQIMDDEAADQAKRSKKI